MKSKSCIGSIASSLVFAFAAFTAVSASAAPVRNIVLVHGYFADGSGWQAVAKILTHDGYKVSVVQQPETSVADDVKATNRILDLQDGPTILVGHSYGGVVITEAGNNDKVAGLVYVAAFEPDAGESAMTLAKSNPSASTAIKPTADGFLYLDAAHYRADFAADVPAAEANFMAISQVLANGQTFGTPIDSPAWKNKPSWAIISTKDRMINPDLERTMAKRAGSKPIELPASHAVYISHAAAVAKVIENAAKSTSQ